MSAVNGHFGPAGEDWVQPADFEPIDTTLFAQLVAGRPIPVRKRAWIDPTRQLVVDHCGESCRFWHVSHAATGLVLFDFLFEPSAFNAARALALVCNWGDGAEIRATWPSMVRVVEQFHALEAIAVLESGELPSEAGADSLTNRRTEGSA